MDDFLNYNPRDLGSASESPDWRVSPAPILKRSINLKPKPVKKQLDFQLAFAEKLELGHSNVSLYRPLGWKPIITPKSYTNHTKEKFDTTETEREIHRLYANGPKEKFKFPKTDSHNYGWNHFRLVQDPHPGVNFAKRTSFLTEFRLKENALMKQLEPPMPKTKLKKN